MLLNPTQLKMYFLIFMSTCLKMIQLQIILHKLLSATVEGSQQLQCFTTLTVPVNKVHKDANFPLF